MHALTQHPEQNDTHGELDAALGDKRNPGTDLELGTVLQRQINATAALQRSQELATRRSVKKAWQVAWDLKAISCMDLTTLAGDDTPGRVRRLCTKARQPVRLDILEALGVGDVELTTGAVCVYPAQVPTATNALVGTGIPVASVATGFPAGQIPLRLRLDEIRYAVDAGANEIDIVIAREYALLGQWAALYDEIAQMREACGNAHLKVILATGELQTLRNVYRASMVAMMAGADFIKTSTGKEAVNATLPVGLVMCRAIRDYRDATGYAVGLKPAGGLRTAKEARVWLSLMREELGRPWQEPTLFRIGASSMLGDIERQLEYYVSGRYSAAHRHGMA